MLLKQQPPKAVAQLLVVILWGFVPLSWVYVILYIAVRAVHARDLTELVQQLWTGRMLMPMSRRPRLGRLLSRRGLFLYALVECCFSVYYRLLQRRIQARTGYHTMTREFVVRAVTSGVIQGSDELSENFVRHDDTSKLPVVKEALSYDDPRAKAFREEMAGWFLGVKPENITRTDVQEWLAWSFFGKYFHEIEEDKFEQQGKLEFINEAVALFEARRGMAFPAEVELTPEEARRKHVILLTLDPVRVIARPLLIYVGAAALSRAITAYFHVLGMRRLRVGDHWYLLYCPANWTPEAAKSQGLKPVVFLHGLGFGPVQYVTVIQGLVAPGGRPAMRPVLVPLQPWESYDFFSPRFLKPWQHDEAADVIFAMLKRHGMDQCGVHVLSHSMGTIVHAWLLRAFPQLISRSVFVDPVCFQLWAPHICYRFLYKASDSFVETILRYFVARELGTANMLMRHFDWSANVLLSEDLPKGTEEDTTLRIYLAGADTVVKADSVLAFLESAGLQAQVRHEPTFHHGEFVLGPKNKMGDIVQFLDQPSYQQ